MIRLAVITGSGIVGEMMRLEGEILCLRGLSVTSFGLVVRPAGTLLVGGPVLRLERDECRRRALARREREVLFSALERVVLVPWAGTTDVLIRLVEGGVVLCLRGLRVSSVLGFVFGLLVPWGRAAETIGGLLRLDREELRLSVLARIDSERDVLWVELFT